MKRYIDTSMVTLHLDVDSVAIEHSNSLTTVVKSNTLEVCLQTNIKTKVLFWG